MRLLKNTSGVLPARAIVAYSIPAFGMAAATWTGTVWPPRATVPVEDHSLVCSHFARHALPLLPRPDGSEAARPRRDRCAPACGGREAQKGSRTAEMGYCGFPNGGGS